MSGVSKPSQQWKLEPLYAGMFKLNTSAGGSTVKYSLKFEASIFVAPPVGLISTKNRPLPSPNESSADRGKVNLYEPALNWTFAARIKEDVVEEDVGTDPSLQ